MVEATAAARRGVLVGCCMRVVLLCRWMMRMRNRMLLGKVAVGRGRMKKGADGGADSAEDRVRLRSVASCFSTTSC